MLHRRACAVLALLAASAPLPRAGAQAPQPPYAGLQAREVKALSEQQVADLRAGRGMGLALPGELNGYPGPLHVLDHADALGLSPAQRERTRALLDAMKAETIPLGERLIRQEVELDRLFATKMAQAANLEAATAAIGATQGMLRAAHLRYHLAMADLLTSGQIRRYAELRGYTAGHGPEGHGTGGAHRR